MSGAATANIHDHLSWNALPFLAPPFWGSHRLDAFPALEFPDGPVKAVPSLPGAPQQRRSSIYRGVTRHGWEAHLWDKSTWNHTQNKKGKVLGSSSSDLISARIQAERQLSMAFQLRDVCHKFVAVDHIIHTKAPCVQLCREIWASTSPTRVDAVPSVHLFKLLLPS
ncbi:hypothetical protein SELMODRAFT_419668 [Selaginella moellendorffii]|uniref:AP2/ERF domain-containing protein n=1 Tax=Selaginella moellendorffii TaxID=88036 RepID=D8S9N4_SELML|nr:hypothetical protein SELMODRAFT_419668 [Selaginella moellendorffii]